MSTSTLQHQATKPPVRAAEVVPDKPNRDTTVAIIVRETGISVDDAERFVNWVASTIGRLRASNRERHFLTDNEWSRYHEILDNIAPDDQVSKPGSAHATLEAHVLDASKGELGLLHRNDGDGEPVYCNVQVRLSVLR